MSEITFSCPDCSSIIRAGFALDEATDRADGPDGVDAGESANSETETTSGSVVECPACQKSRQLLPPRLENGYLRCCLACPSTEMFIRKDFPQRLGVTIVVIGFGLSSVFWAYHRVIETFAVLFATALIDVVLYLTMGNVLECYRCHAQYRKLPAFEDYEQFDLEAFERHRQQAIRLEEAKQQSAQADSSSAL